MQNSIFESMTKQYPISRTLRFELKPIGKTLENLEKNDFLNKDKKRQEESKKLKRILDDFYRELIEKLLNNINLDNEKLKKIFQLYNSQDKKDKKILELDKKEIKSISKDLKKVIEVKSKEFFNVEFKNLFGEELIKKVLIKNLEDKKKLDDLRVIEEFKNWTTYFRGFFENRKNVFQDETKSTSIIYRVLIDNLPRYIRNIKKLEYLYEEKLDEQIFNIIEKDFSDILNGKKIKDFFSIDNYSNFLSQSGIDKYNKIVGGYVDSNGKKIKGLNEYINEVSQKYVNETLTEKEINEKKKKIKQAKLLELYKQILSEREINYEKKEFNNSEEILDEIKKFKNEVIEYYEPENHKKIIVIEELKALLNSLEKYDLSKIYINERYLSDISNEIFGVWNKISSYLSLVNKGYKNSNKGNNKKIKYYNILELENAVKEIANENNEKENISLINYFKSFKYKSKDLLKNIEENYYEVANINLNGKDLRKENAENEVEKIKNFLDNINDLLRFIKPLNINVKNDLKEKEYELDIDFYIEFDNYYKILFQVNPLYNSIRNFITQKPFKTDKIKLNFENNQLLKGWDLNKENDYSGIILRRKLNNRYYYYLVIYSKKKRSNIGYNQFKKIKSIDIEDNKLIKYFEKMVYKQLADPFKDFPHKFFSDVHINFYKPSEEIFKIYHHGSYSKTGEPKKGYEKLDFNLSDCHKLIDFYKESIKKTEDWKIFNFKFKETIEYNDINEFFNDAKEQSYLIRFEYYSEEDILNLVEKGYLFLFKIYNKDFSEYSKGKKNLHTLYFENLFSDENLKDYVFKLNGNAEVFFREPSLEKEITHRKNEQIKNKDPINNKEYSKFEYDLIKYKRYTERKFLFYFPITINFKSPENNNDINNFINSILYKTDNFCVLGIDRGERNLLYYTLIDSKGKIIQQDSFNIYKDDVNRLKYLYEKLENLEKDRNNARKAWKIIKNIKELKEGYLSNIIPRITRLVINNNAIISLENLNYGFKKGRYKFERQIYQKFERKLIEKLNYLVFKDFDINSKGGLLNGFQLANKFDTFKKLSSQSGIIFYVNAKYTSNIDPKTGFVNLIYPAYINIDKSKDFFKKFNYIRYKINENYFEFNFDYDKFTNLKLIKNNWSIYSYGKRVIQEQIKNTNKYNYKEIDLTNEFKLLFENNNIDYKKENIIQDIVNHNNKDFFKKLLWLLKITLQLRNRSENEDYILSCVKNKNGEFFDSRNSKEDEPKNADANGGYNIALKGLMQVEKIKNANKTKRLDYKINDEDFINYIIAKNN